MISTWTNKVFIRFNSKARPNNTSGGSEKDASVGRADSVLLVLSAHMLVCKLWKYLMSNVLLKSRLGVRDRVPPRP